MTAQDMLIFQDGSQFQAIQDISRQVVAQSPSASQVIQQAVDMLAVFKGELKNCQVTP